MNLKAMAMVSLAGLAVAAAGCGNLADSPVAAQFVRYASDGTLVVFAGSAIDTYGPDLSQKKVHISVPSVLGPLFSVSDDGSVAALASEVAGRQVAIFDLSSGGPKSAVNLGQSSGASTPQGVTLSPTGDLLYVFDGVGGDGTSGMFDVSTGKLLWSDIASGEPTAPFFSTDESTLYVLGGGAGLEGMDSRTGTVGLDATPVDSLQAFGGMADPNTLIGVAVSVDPVTYAETSMIDLLSTSDGSTTSQVLLPPGAVFGGSFEQPPSFRCAPAAGVCAFPVLEEDSSGFILSGALQVWALDGTLVQSIDMAGGDVAISPDGQYVASVNDGDVIVYRVSDGSQVKSLPYRNQVL